MPFEAIGIVTGWMIATVFTITGIAKCDDEMVVFVGVLGTGRLLCEPHVSHLTSHVFSYSSMLSLRSELSFREHNNNHMLNTNTINPPSPLPANPLTNRSSL